MTALYDHYGITPDFSDTMSLREVDQNELQDLLDTFIELRDEINKLQWYGKVNRDGFRRILGKLNKFRAGSDSQPYEDSKLTNSQFANQTRCLKDLQHINRVIANLSRARSQSRPSSMYISLFLKNFCARFYSLVPSKAIYHVISEDNASALNQILQEQDPGNRGPKTGFQTLLLALLECSMSHGSRMCIDELLSRLGSLQDNEFVDHDNCLHRLIIRIGRAKASKSLQGQDPHLQVSTGHINSSEESFYLLAYILDRLRPSQRHALREKDSFGRLPLHYAAQYGIIDACQAILKRMQDWGQLTVTSDADLTLLQDSEEYTPLHLGIIGGHTAVTRTLLDFHKMSVNKIADDQHMTTSLGSLLVIALTSGYFEIVKLLVSTRVSVNYQDKDGKTVLYIAARSGHEDYVKIVLEALSDLETDTNVREIVYGWTPLFIACVEGHLPVVELLLQAGTDLGLCDHLGWTANDHAAFRGHMQVAKTLRASEAGELAYTPSREHFQGEAADPGSRIANAIQQDKANVTSVGRRGETSNHYPPSNESHVFVNLGSLDLNKDIMAVDLSTYLAQNKHTQQYETSFSVEICIIGGTGSSSVIQLPVLEDMTNEPLHFLTRDLSQVKLVFNIFRATIDANKGDVLIGSGIALLETFKQGLGSKRESLIRYYTIPIVERDTLDFIGTVTFNFSVVTPFPHPSAALTPIQELPRPTGGTKVVGHRGCYPFIIFLSQCSNRRKGLGQNVAARKHLQIGENTIQVSTAVNS